MKKAIIIVAIVAAAAVICTLLIVRGLPGGLIGSGNLETEEYAFTNFTKVEISSAFEFEIKQSSSYSINVTADDNVMEYVQVSQVGQTLKIGLGAVPRLEVQALGAQAGGAAQRAARAAVVDPQPPVDLLQRSVEGVEPVEEG